MKKLFFLAGCLLFIEIAKAQNVGIGTATPAGKLQINHKNTAISPSLNLFDSATGVGNQIQFSKQGFTANLSIWSGILGNSSSVNSLNFQHSGGSPIMTIMGDGKVGINEENPGRALDVNGDINFSGKLFAGNNSGLTGQPLISGGSGNPAWYPDAYFTANGKVGIGIATPTEILHVTGNIKMDTAKPEAIKFTPNAGTGKILTSDANGNASWQASSVGGGVGFGAWGDCSTNSISEYNPVADTTGATGDFFGGSVSISGNYAIVGAANDDVGANVNQGSAVFFNGTEPTGY